MSSSPVFGSHTDEISSRTPDRELVSPISPTEDIREKPEGTPTSHHDLENVVQAEAREVNIGNEPDNAKAADERVLDQGPTEMDTLCTPHHKLCDRCLEGLVKFHRQEIDRLRTMSFAPEPEPEPRGEGALDTSSYHYAEAQAASLTKIPDGSYRKVKNWETGTFDGCSAILMTSDGGRFGYSGDSGRFEKEDGSGLDIVRETMAHIPFRLVFNSIQLIDALSEITDSDYVQASYPVLVRPFKFLIYNEAKIRDAYAQLRAAVVNEHSTPSLEGEALDETEKAPLPSLGKNACLESSGPSKQNSHYTDEALLDEDKQGATTDSLSKLVCGLDPSPRNCDLIRTVIEFMDREMDDITEMRKRIADGTLREISFEYLWHLYTPGDLVLAEDGEEINHWRAYRVLHVTGGRPQINKMRREQYDGPFDDAIPDETRNALNAMSDTEKLTPVILDCFYIDFDGKKFGPRSKQFILHEYKGLRKINSLQVYPAKFDTMHATETLLARGRKFTDVVRYSHMNFDGIGYYRATSYLSESRMDKISGQCIIDQEEALSNGVGQRYRGDTEESFTNPLHFGKGVLKQATAANKNETYEKPPSRPDMYRDRYLVSEATDISPDHDLDLDKRSEYIEQNTLLQNTTVPTEYHVVLLPDAVWGYVLSRRDWYLLRVSCLSPIRWSSAGSPFQDLVLPRAHKETIEALVRYQTKQMRSREKNKGYTTDSIPTLDLVQGKGRGLTILLHGMPGTGKTSTAECVAEQLRRPLFTITCGDLGLEAASMEENLDRYFRLAVRWSCVALLDEADVFLTHRTTGEYERNSLVSVFLRQLEYHSGVLILTTNRVGEFDEAIASRIHIKLQYPRLDKDSTREIWRINLRRITENPAFDIKVNDADILKFAEKHWAAHEDRPGRQWNGRQIKNAFQTAVALADFEWESLPTNERPRRPTLKRKHFKQVAETSVHFDRHIDRIHGARSQGAFSEAAHRHGYRFDEPDPVYAPATATLSHTRDGKARASYDHRPRRISPPRIARDRAERSPTLNSTSDEDSQSGSEDEIS